MKFFFLITFFTILWIKLTAQTVSTQYYSPSVLLEKGQVEFKCFNNLYTQTSSFNSEGKNIYYGKRSSYFTSINQLLIGTKHRINIGADVWVKSVRIDEPQNSPFKVFKFENGENARAAIAYAGPKIKFSPFKNIHHLSVQSTFLLPIASDLESKTNNRPYLDADRYLWITQIFYDYQFSSKLQFFSQLGSWLSIDRKFKKQGSSSFASPLTAFLNYLPNNRFTIYVENEIWPTYGKSLLSSYFFQSGAGVKYQLIPGSLEAEVLYTKFILGKNSGAGETYNIGIRYIRR